MSLGVTNNVNDLRPNLTDAFGRLPTCGSTETDEVNGKDKTAARKSKRPALTSNDASRQCFTCASALVRLIRDIMYRNASFARYNFTDESLK